MLVIYSTTTPLWAAYKTQEYLQISPQLSKKPYKSQGQKKVRSFGSKYNYHANAASGCLPNWLNSSASLFTKDRVHCAIVTDLKEQIRCLAQC